MSILHCQTCTCTAPVPKPSSDVRLLPVDLDRQVTFRGRNGETGTSHCMQFVAWDPATHWSRGGRLREYRYLLHSGKARNVREAVKMLAARRREWMQVETARHAEALRLKYTDRRPSHVRAFPRKRDLVLAGDVRCAYCGTDNPRSVDHIFPTSRGGDHRRKNLTPACRWCNSQKGNRTPGEWKAARLAVGSPWPPPPTGEQPHIPQGVSSIALSGTQAKVLEHLAQSSEGAELPDGIWDRTIRSLERNRLMARVPNHYFHTITDRGRLALATGRIPH